jgi:hypothetical protein
MSSQPAFAGAAVETVAPPVRAAAAQRRRGGVAIAMTLAVAAYGALHVATIVRSRQVWFDETFFASVADSLRQAGELRLAVSPLWLGGPVYLYGPVYFWIIAPVFASWGIGPAQNRIPGLLFGFAVLALVFLILRQARVRRPLALGVTGLLALDPTFHQSIHSGRTDTTAMALLFGSFLCLLRSRAPGGGTGVGLAIGSGVLAALSVLTTPRPGYMLAPMVGILALRWLRTPSRAAAAQMIAWGAAFACLYGAWILYAFGGITQMLAYYAGFADTYTGGSQVRLVHVPLLAAVAAFIAVLLANAPRRVFDEVTVFALPAIVGFYLLVKSAPSFGAIYSFLMIPPAYLALGVLAERVSAIRSRAQWARLLVAGTLAMLAVVNGTAFLARSALEIAEWQRRDPARADAVIARSIPPGSRVVGNDQYYFAVRRAGSDFQYAERGGTVDERVAYHRDDYDFDYLITSEGDDSPLLQAYRAAVPLREVAAIDAAPTTPLAERIVAIGRAFGLSNSLMSGYQGRVFARTR